MNGWKKMNLLIHLDNAFFLIILFPFVIYIAGLIAFIIGNIKKFNLENKIFHPNISVIVAIRNGGDSVQKILNCLGIK